MFHRISNNYFNCSNWFSIEKKQTWFFFPFFSSNIRFFSIIDEYLTGVYEARFRIVEEKGESREKGRRTVKVDFDLFVCLSIRWPVMRGIPDVTFQCHGRRFRRLSPSFSLSVQGRPLEPHLLRRELPFNTIHNHPTLTRDAGYKSQWAHSYFWMWSFVPASDMFLS